MRETSLRNEVFARGIGVHSGRAVSVRIMSAPKGAGWNFVRLFSNKHAELKPAPLHNNLEDDDCYLSSGPLPLTFEYFCGKQSRSVFSWQLRGKQVVSLVTCEHLMSAISALCLDNFTLQLDGEELPIVDGSSKFWLDKLLQAGVCSAKSAAHIGVAHNSSGSQAINAGAGKEQMWGDKKILPATDDLLFDCKPVNKLSAKTSGHPKSRVQLSRIKRHLLVPRREIYVGEKTSSGANKLSTGDSLGHRFIRIAPFEAHKVRNILQACCDFYYGDYSSDSERGAGALTPLGGLARNAMGGGNQSDKDYEDLCFCQINLLCDFSRFSDRLASSYIFHNNLANFSEHIAPARTFGKYSELKKLQDNNLALGADYSNSLGLDDDGALLNPCSHDNRALSESEPIRHKILDFLGDLSTLPGYLLGYLSCANLCHEFNSRVLYNLVENLEDYFEVIEINPKATG